MFAAHILSMFLYLSIPIMSVIVARKCYIAFEGYPRIISIVYLGMTSTLAVIFMILQIKCSLLAEDKSASFYWLVFEYLNAIGYTIGVSLIGMGADLYRTKNRELKRCRESMNCPKGMSKPTLLCYVEADTNKSLDPLINTKHINSCVAKVNEAAKSLRSISDKVIAIGK